MFFELHYRDPQADEASQQADHKKDSASLTPDGLGDAGNGDVGDEEGGYYYVRTFTWTPQFGQQETVLDVCSNNKAGEGCRLSTLRNAVLDSTIDSGSWEQICHHVPFTQAEEIAKKAVYNTGNAVGTDDDGPGSVDQPSPSRTIRMGAVVATVAAVLLAWLGAVVVKTKWLSSDRRSEIYEPVR